MFVLFGRVSGEPLTLEGRPLAYHSWLAASTVAAWFECDIRFVRETVE